MLKPLFDQNFLIDQEITLKIIDIIRDLKPELIVEIGPGYLNLTKYFVKFCFKFVLVEIDKKISQYIKNYFKKIELLDPKKYYLELYRGDITDSFILRSLIKNASKNISLCSTNRRQLHCSNILFSSLPYSICISVILSLHYVYKKLPSYLKRFYFIVPQWLIEKTFSNNNSKIKTILATYFEIYSFFKIDKTSFSPQPRINSFFCQFRIKDYKNNFFSKKFLRFLNVYFKRPFKKLKNNKELIALGLLEDYWHYRPAKTTMKTLLFCWQSIKDNFNF